MSSTIAEKISHETIRRTLHQYGFHGRTPIRKPLINDGRFKIWREAGKVLAPKITIKTVKFGGGSVLVCGWILNDNLGGKVPVSWGLGQQDNDPNHIVKIVQLYLLYHCRKQLYTPDLNVIENFWSQLEKAVHEHKITSKEVLKKVLREEWAKLSVETTNTMVESMPRKLQTVIQAKGKQISGKTVARRLRGGGLYARRPVVCVPLTRQHRTARLQWCREHHNWTEQDWACVLFSDECRFSLSSDCRRQLIWRESGTAYRPENIQEKDRYPTCSITVWVGTRLHVVANGTMTGQRYIDEVLLPHVRLFRGAPSDCLDSEDIQRLVWPARSPDLNPIENVWDALGRQIAGRNYPPTNKNTLIRALTEEWDKLPQQLLDNVVQINGYGQGLVAGKSMNSNPNVAKTPPFRGANGH
ncbi:transposable element Tcb2 transposase [Trichonephila clavipes]|nr:transposable element Tcb2 transposase [Trichonephila clavipes]